MNIKNARFAAGITQEQLAQKMEVERSTVAKWETGKSSPRVELLPKLSEILGCTVDELLGITKTPDRSGQA